MNLTDDELLEAVSGNYIGIDFDGIIDMGIIEFSDILTEETIDSNHKLQLSGGVGACRIVLHYKEGDIPHFHIESISKGQGGDKLIDACIRLDTNEYFDHPGHEGILNSKQCKQLEKWLNGKMNWDEKDENGNIIKREKVTRWEFMKRSCKGSENNNVNPITIGSKPDYNTINPKGTKKQEEKNEKK